MDLSAAPRCAVTTVMSVLCLSGGPNRTKVPEVRIWVQEDILVPGLLAQDSDPTHFRWVAVGLEAIPQDVHTVWSLRSLQRDRS
jgi:hypothetical protein